MAGFLHLVTVQNKQHFPLFLIMCQNLKKKKLNTVSLLKQTKKTCFWKSLFDFFSSTSQNPNI